ncbi:MAG: hypothetical protein B0W54_23425 [Cellvibrio sp. 79]|nr:MAG: hypothetical protein B0W54_23425 [Cellvibrio sp. 79]
MQTPPQLLTPLGIIFLFVALSEIVLGISISQTQSWLQIVLAVFSCVFPSGVAIAFFYILYHRPENFYAPKDFAGDASYLQNMKEARAIRLQRYSEATVNLQHTVEEGIKAATMRPELRDPTKRDLVVAEEIERVNKEIRESFITIDCSFFEKDIGIITLPIAAYDTLNDLTDELFFVLQDHVRPFAYGYDWLLRHKEKNEIILSRRVIERVPVGIPAPDLRSLKELGILGGATLEAIPPAQKKVSGK